MLNFTYRVRSLFHRIHVHSHICIAVFYKPGDMILHFGTQMLHKDSGVELRKMMWNVTTERCSGNQFALLSSMQVMNDDRIVSVAKYDTQLVKPLEVLRTH